MAATKHAALCPRTSAGTNVTLTRSQLFAKKNKLQRVSVTKFEWREPHSMVEIKGKDEKGNGREMFAASSFFDRARAGASTAGTRGHEEAAPTTGKEPAPKPQR